MRVYSGALSKFEPKPMVNKANPTVQWAAVKIQPELMREPPQILVDDPLDDRIEACQGN